jgi:hypothetical protein
VRTLEAWLQASDCRYNPVFRKIDRGGSIESTRCMTCGPELDLGGGRFGFLAATLDWLKT